MTTPEGEPGDRTPPTLSPPSPILPLLRRIALTLLWLVLLTLLARQVAHAPADVLDRLGKARPGLIAAGVVIYALGFAARAARLNLLLPPADRIPFGRAWAVSGATTFLLQVLPFRGGEVASWALYRRVLGTGWARAGAVFVLVKTLDSAAFLLAGLAGAAALALRSGVPVLGGATAVAVAAGTVLLVLMPRLGVPVVEAAARRFAARPRLARGLGELAEGLRVAREAPGAYLLAFAGAVAFLAGHFAALTLLFSALGLTPSLPALAFASLASVLSAAVLPSPAGTFGPMESGFAAGLALEGVPLALGATVTGAVHLLTTIACGVVGLPLLGRRGARDLSPRP
ncbi:MAG: flippase-like domain-containing protein [Holophagales bacterium]|nr:flippase-like domain-containing protein [Holophagales bacterium]